MQRPARTAAVLVGILDRPRPEIVLTRRALHLAHHPGQVSFPGGAAEAAGETAVATALREAEEEIGLAPATVKPLGFLDRVDTISDFRVLPVVGLLSHVGPWTPDQCEVDEVFTVPLERALDRAAYQEREMEGQGRRHVIYSMEWDGRTIWGITAAILINFAHRIERAASELTG
jgi:8-oxo-dGTP pyrophosphatase MutT (NUDIX family)